MPKLKLTERNVAAIGHSDEEVIYWDATLSGFGLRVQPAPSDRKAFILRYRNDRKQQRFMTLGTSDLINAGKARKKAIGILSRVVDGEDPAKERRDASETPTLEQFLDRYLVEYAALNKKKSSIATDKINIRCQIYPNIRRTKRVTDIHRQDVDKMKAALKDKPGAFNRARAVLSKAMELAEEWEIRPQNSNPCRYVKQYRLENRERYLSAEEFAALGQALAESERTAIENPYAIAAIRLLIFLGARRGEILNLKWEDIDIERGLIMLPDSKTGKKPLFLNPPALEILDGLKRVKGNPYVIPGRKKGQPLADLKRPWNRIRRAAGLEGVRLHDLRHSFASVGAMGGVPLQIVGQLLGHSNMATTERYSHLANDPVKAANDAIGQQIAAAMNSNKETAEVISLSSKKGA